MRVFITLVLVVVSLLISSSCCSKLPVNKTPPHERHHVPLSPVAATAVGSAAPPSPAAPATNTVASQASAPAPVLSPSTASPSPSKPKASPPLPFLTPEQSGIHEWENAVLKDESSLGIIIDDDTGEAEVITDTPEGYAEILNQYKHHHEINEVQHNFHSVTELHDMMKDEGGRKFSAENWVVHPIQLPTSPSSGSGLNFSTYIYPTPQGNVTMFIGTVEYPLNNFHFYPAPRQQQQQTLIQLQQIFNNNKRNVKQEMKERRMKQQSVSVSPEKTHETDSLYESLSSGSIPPVSPSFVSVSSSALTANPLCDGRALTSDSARFYGCLFAQNAGFFDMETGGCLGDVISHDQLINRAEPNLYNHVHFGLTRKGDFLTGYLTRDEVNNGVDGGYHELIQGSGWLVREGMPYINISKVYESLGEGFVQEKAPRNALGHDAHGRLIMVEADGEEDIALGLDLYEFSTILLKEFQVVNAINVDGGGSSVTVYKYEVVDKPTCHDTPEKCEREVTTISCVMP